MHDQYVPCIREMEVRWYQMGGLSGSAAAVAVLACS